MAEEKGYQHEESTPGIKLEVKFDQEISEQDLKDLNEFAEGEVDSVLEKAWKMSFRERMSSAEWNSEWTAAYVHNEAYQTIKRAKEGEEKERTNLIIARNERGELVGYSVITINMSQADPERVTSTFIGVRPGFQRQGIGTELLRKRIDLLLGMGIKSYKSNVRQQALRLYDRLGVPYAARPLSESGYDKPQAITVDLSHYGQ